MHFWENPFAAIMAILSSTIIAMFGCFVYYKAHKNQSADYKLVCAGTLFTVGLISFYAIPLYFEQICGKAEIGISTAFLNVILVVAGGDLLRSVLKEGNAHLPVPDGTFKLRSGKFCIFVMVAIAMLGLFLLVSSSSDLRPLPSAKLPATKEELRKHLEKMERNTAEISADSFRLTFGPPILLFGYVVALGGLLELMSRSEAPIKVGRRSKWKSIHLRGRKKK